MPARDCHSIQKQIGGPHPARGGTTSSQVCEQASARLLLLAEPPHGHSRTPKTIG